jgi:hypothetical protein
MVFRNLLTVMGVFAVIGIVFLVIKPDWIKQIASNPSPPVPGPINKVNARLCGERLRLADLPKEQGGFLQVEELSGVDSAQKIVEEIGEDVPSRNSPYLLIVNKSTSAMRYCRLGACVRKIQLKLAYPEVKIQQVSTTPGGPYQVIIWVPQAMDLQMEIDVAADSATRS